MDKEKEVKLLDIQLIATILYIVSLIISISLTINDKQITQKKKSIFTNNQAKNLSIFNRIFIVVLTLTFLYISYQNRDIAKKEKKKIWPFDLQMYASELSLLATIIVLYVVIENLSIHYLVIKIT